MYTRSLLCVVALIAGCAGAHPRQATVADSTEALVLTSNDHAHLTREVALPPLRRLSSDDGVLTVTVPATLSGPIKRLDSEHGVQYKLTLDIGTATPVQCTVAVNRFDIASTLERSANDAFADLDRRVKAKLLRQIISINAGSAGRAPYLEAVWIVVTQADDERQVGSVKLITGARDTSSAICQHIGEPGYSESFSSVARSVLESFELQGISAVRADYEEISTTIIAAMTVGIQSFQVFVTDDGTLRIEQISSMIVPTSAQDLAHMEGVNISIARKDGSLLRKDVLRFEKNEAVTVLRAQPDVPGRWRVEGTFEREAYTASFAAERPASTLTHMMVVADMIERGDIGKTRKYQYWDDIDPSQAIDVETTITNARSDGNYDVRMMLGPLAITGIFDHTGSALSATMSAHGGSVQIDRIYKSGAW
jgi:hypothetical protein